MNYASKQFLFFLFLSIQSLMAYEYEVTKPLLKASFDLFGGYRTDEISTIGCALNPNTLPFFTDDLKARNLRIGEMGVEGRLINGKGGLLRGFANYGWLVNGSYRNMAQKNGGSSLVSKAKIRAGHVADLSIGLGYLFTIEHYFTIGPLIGWAFDSQKICMHHAESEDYSSPLADHFDHTMTWQGPWIGFEMAYELGSFKFRSGYDFHFANWKGTYKTRSLDIEAMFSSKSSRGYGNATFVDVFYVFCGGWELGVGVKYQYWTSRRDHVTSRFFNQKVEGIGVSKIHCVRWKSCEGHLILGYHF